MKDISQVCESFDINRNDDSQVVLLQGMVAYLKEINRFKLYFENL
jgi:hypothetical protein